MRKEEVKRIIESLLFAHEHPLTVDNIVKIIGDQAGKKEIKETLMELLAEYQGMGRSFQLVEVDGGYQFRTKAAYARWIKNLRKVKPTRLSQSALETLAIVVYRQPIVRAEIEHIRGVDSGWVLNSLLEKGLIKILGRKEVAGRPLVYGSSRRFLEIFGLRDLSALPTLQELDALRGKEGAELQEGELPKEEG
ncbi:MAG: SMC-Scp complex subunit ScpB [Deltaproteobacteria bacterium]|nr:SMC-Scp complex subunit ScpB [Deltaproteobacteria bacterium]